MASMKYANRSQLAQRIISTANAAADLAARGRRPRNNGGDPFALRLAECAREQGELAACRRAIAEFEAAWRVNTPEAREVVKRRARDTWITRDMQRQAASMYHAATPEQQQIADNYGDTSGKVRKRYRMKHNKILKATGAITGLGSPLDWHASLQRVLEQHPHLA